jgi:glycosyltransferase involved in cell wall biosynthesis
VAIVHAWAEPALRTPQHLLERYTSLTGWAAALLRAGASGVGVVQRFGRESDREQEGVEYAFRSGWTSAHWRRRAIAQLAAFQPDVVHVNGLCFPREVAAIRRAWPRMPIVVQHHGEACPRNPWRRLVLRAGLRHADAILFTGAAQASRWQAAGLLRPSQPVVDIVEASTDLAPRARGAVPAITALPGAPAILWVGRLNENKDPLTVLDAFAAVAPALPRAHLTLAFHEAPLFGRVDAWRMRHADVAGRVHLLGRLTRAELRDAYSTADLFVLGSRCEGSGYALIEAIACGVVPVVTDIPPFRSITGDGAIGVLWPAGDRAACGAAIVSGARRLSATARDQVRRHFERELSWETIGHRACQAYASLIPQPEARAVAR